MSINNWDDLCILFRDQLIPLLREYFFNDTSKIVLILGDNDSQKAIAESFFVSKDSLKSNIFADGFNSETENDIFDINPMLQNGTFDEMLPGLFTKSFRV